MASITGIHLPRSCSAVLQRTAFPWMEVSKAAQKVGQAVPKIPLSIGSKLELLLRTFVFAKFPYTSPYTHTFVRVCIFPCIYVLGLYNVYDRGTKGFAL